MNLNIAFGVAPVKSVCSVLTKVANVLKHEMPSSASPTEKSGMKVGARSAVVSPAVATLIGGGTGVVKISGTIVGVAGKVKISTSSEPMRMTAETNSLLLKLRLMLAELKFENADAVPGFS